MINKEKMTILDDSGALPLPKARQIPFATQPIDGVTQVIACASGKGGVGKSTTTVALAYELTALGARVGILDCDIHGPNIGCLLEVSVDAEQHDLLEPVMVDGVVTQSIAYWVAAEVALAWRGPMVTKALLQMAYQTRWPELDFLLLDMPPETGDIALSICKKLPLCAAFLVATTQRASLADVQRAYCLFERCKIPVLGVVENMSGMQCEACGHVSVAQHQSDVVNWATSNQMQQLANIPFVPALHLGHDLGNTMAEPSLAAMYKAMAINIVQQLNTLPRDYSRHFGKIEVNPAGEHA